jgi:hypothetical protein
MSNHNSKSQCWWQFKKGWSKSIFSVVLFNLNYGIITLLPKSKEATNIKQFRPICLINVSFKIFTEVAVRRLTQVVDKLISQSQTVFVPGQNIMEGVVIPHEIIHELHRKKMNEVILKLDFEKHMIRWNRVLTTNIKNERLLRKMVSVDTPVC